MRDGGNVLPVCACSPQVVKVRVIWCLIQLFKAGNWFQTDSTRSGGHFFPLRCQWNAHCFAILWIFSQRSCDIQAQIQFPSFTLLSWQRSSQLARVKRSFFERREVEGEISCLLCDVYSAEVVNKGVMKDPGNWRTNNTECLILIGQGLQFSHVKDAEVKKWQNKGEEKNLKTRRVKMTTLNISLKKG